MTIISELLIAPEYALIIETMRKVLYWLVRLLYRYRAYNAPPLDLPGPVLLLPNHVSWWDWLLVGVVLDDDWHFVTSSTTAETSWVHKLVMVNRRTFPVDMNSPYAVKHMAEFLLKGGRLVLFPEGRMSATGSLMKLFDGTGFLIFKTKPKVITAYIRGAQRLPFSRSPGKTEWFPRLSVHFSDVLVPPGIHHVSATEDRLRLTDWVHDQMVRQRFETELEFGPATVAEGIVAAARKHPGLVVMQDTSLQEVTYRRLLTGGELLADQWRKRFAADEQRVGVLLPNVNAMPVTLLSLWAAGRVPAILNYTSGAATQVSCARLAELKHIITSKVFLERAKLDVKPFQEVGIEPVFLEDVRKSISGPQRILALLHQYFKPGLSTRDHEVAPTSTAVILFTSGSEGDPKGVELTHRNLRANIEQMLASIDVMDTDRFFSALPLFHSFGLTVGLLLPLARGVFVQLYVSPLHYRIVPSAFYSLNCTIFFGTNTFLNGYARKANPFDFRTLRYLFAGAEKLQDSTATLWMRKFGVRILEGYGVTECSPCLSANLALRPNYGSVGQLLPGIEYRLEPVEGIKEGGRLLVRGPNVMRGYLNPEANENFLALKGWYDTGDVVRVDADGYIFIQGRLKRFAKISGEMVSLAAVEEALANAFPRYGLRFAAALVARPDESKGEKLILITNEPRLTLEEVRAAIQSRGLNNLSVPREMKVLHDLPRLSTGKIDHRELEKVVGDGS